jgi:hypothetical protein
MTHNGLAVLSFVRERKGHGLELRESVSKFSLIWTLWLGLLAAAEPRDVVAAEPSARLTLEAIALFRSVVKHKLGELGSCALADRWNHYPVPEKLARRHLGMKLHAELVSPSTATTPAEVIDPQGAIRQAFCSNAEAARQMEAQVEDFRRGALNIEKGPFDVHPRLRVVIRDYSFPVFDRGYRRAVIVITYTSRDWVKVSDGEVRSLGLSGAGEAVVYAKHGGLWQSVAREHLFHAD